MLLVSPVKRHQDPQGLEHPTCSRNNDTTSIAENHIQGDTTAQERRQDHRDETRQQQTEAKQKRSQKTSGQPARKDPNQPGNHIAWNSQPSSQHRIQRTLQTTFRRGLHRQICARRLGPRNTTENQQQDRSGNNRQSHCSNAPSSCETRMNFSHLHEVSEVRFPSPQ